nr:spore germination protein [Paenibacillus methanolicus]
MYADCTDVVFHECRYDNQSAVLLYIDGLTNTEELDRQVLKPLVEGMLDFLNPEDMRQKLALSSTTIVHTLAEIALQAGEGSAILLVDGHEQGIALCLPSVEKRSISEPSAEPVVRGPREGFVESLRVNTSLLRKRLKSPRLKFKSMKIGRFSQTNVVLAYIEGIASPSLLDEVEKRLSQINVEGLLDTAILEEYLETNKYSPFPQLLASERPDLVTANLLEGRVGIIAEGSPFVLIAPVSVFSFFQSSEDYYQRFMYGTALRWLRYFFAFIALLGPSLYVSILSFHQEMIPSTLMLSVAQSRDQIPFPAFVEALLMEITFEGLREAGTRLPKQVGAAVSIVGALVIGQAAIQSGIVSAPMVMVVAMTGIASFMIPNHAFGISVRLLRFPIMFFAACFGLLGVILAVLLINNHLLSLRSLGEPYFEPIAPFKRAGLQDVLGRAPYQARDASGEASGTGDAPAPQVDK